MSSDRKIYFFLEEVSYNMKHKRLVREWITKAAENEGFTIGTLNYIFTSDNVLVQLNKEYLRHFTLTDIITFDMAEKEGELTGDIYISLDRAKDNAREFKVTLNNELARLMIHGVLHLMGYKDKTTDEKALMRAREEFYLSLSQWS
jgi:rRNA maturation RNase YbeY